MTSQQTTGVPGSGDLSRSPSNSLKAMLDQPFLAVEMNHMLGPQIVQSVEPWGFIVPGELMTTDAAVVATIQAHWVPQSTTFILRLVPDDGSQPYVAQSNHVGPDPLVCFRLPNDWLASHVGRTVYLGYEAVLPGDTRINGPGIDFQITSLLTFPPIRFEGLGDGEPLDPSRFPDGLVAVCDRIAEIRKYHRAELQFVVFGVKDGDSWPITLRTYPLDGIQDRPITFTIDPEAYTGHHEHGYAALYASISLRADMIPPPNPHPMDTFPFARLDIVSSG